ncbi:MAG: family 10 glycosylhydrolase, partial [Planctomycetota bacterium]
WITIPLAELISGSRKVDLDNRGSRLLVRRAPGDAIRVALERDSLVFSPGERLSFTFEPSLLPVEPGSKVRLRIELTEARAPRGRLVEEHHLVAGESAPIEQPVTLPDEEGAYDLLITATHAAWRRWTQPVRGQQPFATRRIQVLVLSPHAPVASETPGSQAVQVEEIDPANPKWWERFATLPHPRRLPRLWKGPLGNGYSQTRTHPLGQLVELGSCPNAGDLAWEAYTLPIEEPGRPHVLEVDYPSDVPQTMGISIIEPNSAGAVVPIGLDSGVELAEELTGQVGPARWLKHRMIFWPKTKSPMVLITNRREGAPAVYGKIRVLAFSGPLPPFASPGPFRGLADNRAGLPWSAQRLLAAYLDRPLFPENFSASQAPVASSGLAADDWVTFHQGGTRLVEYLDHVGFGGLMISVMAGGSTIYPSAVLEPTARYDTGVLQDEGQDPIRKDVLEMLFRLFDRQKLALIPALEFAAPLAALEAELRRGGDQSAGIRWVGPQGKTWLQTYSPRRGTAPYYNVLHPRVQEVMLAAVREVAQRYRHHGSFAGLAIQLSGQGYAQLPGPNWGMDDVTIGRFERDTNLRVPGEGPERFLTRAQFLAESFPRQWLEWRAEQLSRFYRRVQAELVAARPQMRLYLAGANMLTGEDLEGTLRPALPREMTISEAMLRVGIDSRHYADDPGVVLLRPERILPERPLARQAVNLEIQQMLKGPNSQPQFSEFPIPGSLFFNPPQEVRLASFDAKSPFEPSYTWLATEPVPGAWQNRRRFVQSLAALDSQVMFDGGWLLAMGQEDSLRNVVAAYRELPAIRFRRLTDQSGSDPAQPVTIRYATHEGATYVYVVNDAPFATVARIDLACPIGCQLEGLGGVRPAPPLERGATGTRWTVELEPYDLVAVRLSAPEVGLSRPQVWWSDEVQTELKARIAELGSRAAVLRKPPILDVLENPGFEAEPTEDARIPGWAASNQPGVTVEL